MRKVLGDQLDGADEQHRIDQPRGFPKPIESGRARKSDRGGGKADGSDGVDRARVRRAGCPRNDADDNGDELSRTQAISTANLFTRIGSEAAAFKAGQDRFASGQRVEWRRR
jgi:hypothetical protein